MDYPQEQFTAAEERLLAPHFTNLDSPVFCVVDLPEVTKGALFARYSRYGGTLRRLYLDEFAGQADAGVQAAVDTARADQLYERVFLEFGDDSVAQLGGAHLACEWSSNVLTKILQRGRLAAYLEQSTRYIPYDRPMPSGRYRYYWDPRLGAPYAEAMERIFDLYSAGLERLREWAAEQHPRGDEPQSVWERSIKAKALDAMRGLLPAASLSHVGVYASGQAYEQLLMRLLASPLPEARDFGERALIELRKVIPAFVKRVDMPDRGGAWIEYLRALRERASDAAARFGLDDEARGEEPPAVHLERVDGTEGDLIAACLFEAAGVGEEGVSAAVEHLDTTQRARLIADLAGPRANRRHKPGRGWEALRYRFEIVSDYGAFRDLQRHRMLTCQWQRLGTDLGADVPEEVEAAGYGDAYRAGLEVSRVEHDRLRGESLVEDAAYAVSLAYRIRYVLDLNAREAMHLIELRSGREGHPSYRAVALEMLDRIAAVHPAVAQAMTFVDHETEGRLERLQGEMRRHGRLQAAGK
ncbi:MAG TPA: FAD-dependent thymidylate synthase [Solirubrobacterales bacterium]|nr:FAD-dependent thymidylate synthase [Solirubrobacterales bacterium]